MAIEVQPAVSPHLVVGDGAAAIDFYVKAFSAVELGRVPGPDGKLMHAALQINGSTVLLNDDFPEYNDGKSSTPTALGGTTLTGERLLVNGMIVACRLPRGKDDIGRRHRECHRRQLCYPGAQLFKRRLLGNLTHFVEEVIRQRHAGQRGERLEPAMQIVGHIADLDHLRHVPRANYMCCTCQAKGLRCLRPRERFATGATLICVAVPTAAVHAEPLVQ